MIDYILFDLDGTLTDSAPGILNSIEYAIKKMNLPKENRDNLRRFLGPPLTEAFSEYYKISLEDAYKMVMYFREYFQEKGILENTPYDGILNMLSSLSKDGKKIALATSKPEHFAIKILKHFELFPYFDCVCGSPPEEKDCPKSEIISKALQTLNVTDLSKAVMVGDRKYDALGAKSCNIKSIGVLYGYGTTEEMEASSFDYLAQDVEDLHKILITI